MTSQHPRKVTQARLTANLKTKMAGGHIRALKEGG